MKKIVVLCLLAVVSLASAKEIKWLSFQEGVKLVKQQKKPAILDFYGDWCHYCKVMDKTTFANAKVLDKLQKNYITIRIDPDRDKGKIDYEGKTYSPAEFMQVLGIRGLPTIVFMDKETKLITLLPGYVDDKTLLPILDYIHKECYAQKITLDDYLKKEGKCE